MDAATRPTSTNLTTSNSNAAATAFAASLAAAASSLDNDFFRLAAASSSSTNPFQIPDFSRVAAAAAVAHPYFMFRPQTPASMPNNNNSSNSFTGSNSPFLAPTLPLTSSSSTSTSYTNSNHQTSLTNGNSSRSESPTTSTNNKIKSLKFGQLTSTDVHSIKSLITSYRESASFLNRSADELDQLINSSSDN